MGEQASQCVRRNDDRGNHRECRNPGGDEHRHIPNRQMTSQDHQDRIGHGRGHPRRDSVAGANYEAQQQSRDDQPANGQRMSIKMGRRHIRETRRIPASVDQPCGNARRDAGQCKVGNDIAHRQVESVRDDERRRVRDRQHRRSETGK